MSHIREPGFQLPPNAYPGWKHLMGQVAESLPSMSETWIEFLASTWLLWAFEMNQYIGICYLSVPLISSFFLLEKCTKNINNAHTSGH